MLRSSLAISFVPRSSIRGFKYDYHDADVVVLAGETHVHTKPLSACPVVRLISNVFQGAVVITEEMARKRYASRVAHSLIPLQNVLDLAEVLSSRMRLRTEGHLRMGAHMRRGDC